MESVAAKSVNVFMLIFQPLTADMDNNVDEGLAMDTERVQSVEDSAASKEIANSLQKPDYAAKSRVRQQRRNACGVCDGKLFASNAELQNHRNRMHRRYKCQKCFMVLIGRPRFAEHVRNEHPGLPITQVFAAQCGQLDKDCCFLCLCMLNVKVKRADWVKLIP